MTRFNTSIIPACALADLESCYIQIMLIPTRLTLLKIKQCCEKFRCHIITYHSSHFFALSHTHTHARAYLQSIPTHPVFAQRLYRPSVSPPVTTTTTPLPHPCLSTHQLHTNTLFSHLNSPVFPLPQTYLSTSQKTQLSRNNDQRQDNWLDGVVDYELRSRLHHCVYHHLSIHYHGIVGENDLPRNTPRSVQNRGLHHDCRFGPSLLPVHFCAAQCRWKTLQATNQTELYRTIVKRVMVDLIPWRFFSDTKLGWVLFFARSKRLSTILSSRWL